VELLNFIADFGSLVVSSKQEVLSLLLQHIYLSAAAIILAALIAIPGGILISRVKILGGPLIAIAGVLYNIPSLALFGFLVPFFGIGSVTALIALCIYAILPLLRNTYIGLTEVDPAIVEAAKGMGVNDWQLLIRVQLPLALPVIMTAFRQVVVMTIGVTAIAAFVGAGGLGILVFRGRGMMDTPMIVYSTLLIALLAVIADRSFGLVERKIREKMGV